MDSRSALRRIAIHALLLLALVTPLVAQDTAAATEVESQAKIDELLQLLIDPQKV